MAERDSFEPAGDGTGPGPEFEARFDSECGNCGGYIYEGDPIRYDGDDYAHAECVDDD